MKDVSRMMTLALALCLLLAACGGQGALPSDAAPPQEEAPARAAETVPPAESRPAPQEEVSGEEEAPEEEPPAPGGERAPAAPTGPEDGTLAEDIAPALEGLEKTDWQIVSIDAKDYGIVEDPIGDPAVYGGAASLSLGKLIACSLSSDGAAGEDLSDELRKRFLEAPHTMLAYLVLIGDQRVDYWDQPLAADVVCMSIASADAAWYDGSEEFARTLAACRERYPSGRIAELLDVMEEKHAASMERNHGQSQ